MDDDLSGFAEYQETPAPVPVPMLAGEAYSVPDEMVLAIAMGLEDPADVAARHNFTPEQFAQLCTWKPFDLQVTAKRHELEREGITPRIKALLRFNALSDHVFVLGMSQDTTFNQKLELMKTYQEVADLKPKKAEAGPQGPAFSISINLMPAAAPPAVLKEVQGVTLDHQP